MQRYFIFIIYFFTSCLFSQNQFEIFFDFNQDVPNQQSMLSLNDWIKSNPQVEITEITSFCDSVDTHFYNNQLAKRRINAVIDILHKNKISLANNIKLNPVGEDFKKAIHQAENRKAVFSYVEKAQTKSLSLPESNLIVSEEKSAKNVVETERSSLAAKFEKAKVGDRIAIYNINFMFNSETIETSSEPLLEELLFIMERNPKMVIKIHGHICCNPNPNNTKLSFRRALKIFKYLKENGISQNRLAYNGVGSNNPIYRIPEKNEEQRIANRRVEIEIVRK